MIGYTPVELDIRQAAEAAAEDPRAGWFRDVRRVLGIVERHSSLPLPHAGPDAITFYLDTAYRSPGAPRILADAERLLAGGLGVTFTPEMLPAAPSWFILAATLESGLKVNIRAWAADVARRHPLATGDLEWWVRLPVEREGTEAA
jgi:hypothetical protein